MATPGFNIVTSGFATSEDGGKVFINVSLNTQPTTGRNVVVGFASNDTTEGTLDKSVLKFDSTNWNIPQTLTVTGVQDYLNPIFDNNTSYAINAKVDTILTTDVNYRQMFINPIGLIDAEDVTNANDAEPDDRVPVGTIRDTPVKINGDAIVDTNYIDTMPGIAGQYRVIGMLVQNDVMAGLDNNDTLNGGYGQDDISGGLGDDELHGGDDEDYLYGQDGNDFLYGENGNDVMSGGTGNDTLWGGMGADVLNGDEGDDILQGTAGDFAVDTMSGGAGNDIYYIYSDGGNDIIQDNGLASDIDTVMVPYDATSYTLPSGIENATITSGTKACNLTGNASNNLLMGNAGVNIFIGGLGNDTLNGGAGADTASYSSATTNVIVNLTIVNVQNTGVSTGNDTLINIENVIGGKFNDLLTGSKVANTINGGAGVDTINGGAGVDKLTGGTGKDYFVVDSTSYKDAITDFSVADDTINLDHMAFTKLTTLGVLPAANFRVGAAPLDNNDYVIYNKATGVVTYDADGSGANAGVQILVLTGNPVLTNADFVVV